MQLKLFYGFILHEYFIKLFDIHYPREIIVAIIVASIDDIKISCGYLNMIHMINNDIYFCGRNYDDTTYAIKPRKLVFNEKISSVNCGYNYALFTTNNPGMIYTIGRNNYWQLGRNDVACQVEPTLLDLQYKKNIVKIVTAASGAVFVLFEDSRVFCWGSNRYGQLGIGSSDEKCLCQENKNLSNMSVINIFLRCILCNSSDKIWNTCMG